MVYDLRLVVSVAVPASAASFAQATLWVYVENTSLADTGAIRIAERKVSGVGHRRGAEDVFEVSLVLSIPDGRATHTARAHMDLEGDGRISAEDYISKVAQPVPLSDREEKLHIRLEPVRRQEPTQG